MKHSFTIGIDGSGIDAALKGIEEYKKWIKEKTELLTRRLAEIGVQVASEEFSLAEYNGTNDVSVSIENRGDMMCAVVASGEATLFIEFGTGITYPDGHPERPAGVAGRGQYGKWGNNPNGWRYRDYHGQGNGDAQPDPKHPGYYHTYGNPSNMCMYLTVSELEQRFTEIAREVFND